MRNSSTFYFFVLLLFLSNQAFAKTLDYWASAYDIKTNRLLYKERHIERYKNNRPEKFEVLYYTPQGRQFASKIVRFNNTNYDPDIYLNVPNLKYVEFTKHLSRSTYRVGHSKVNQPSIKSKQLKVSRTAVIDNGFDLYIKENMNALKQGKILHFNYIAPAKLDYYRFRIKPVSITPNQIRLHLESDVALARMLTKPVVVEYDLRTNLMTLYEGITNIPKATKGNHDARLVINYN